ncbi:MAG: hypothetical protein PF541_03005 [Prolixibacteraceae bacterium]|nr:hypothetical protein [Prolixibacteraceae bacterium]
MAFSQEKTQAIKFGGSASLSSSFYNSNGIDPRQPANMQVGIIRANISLYDVVELPFELYYSSGQTRFQQPFNQFGVSPRISDWLTLHAGYFSTQFSDLSYGDLRILGGGFELTPGDFRLKAVYGRTRHQMEPNRVSYIPEVYKQNAYAVSIGYGNTSKAYFNINIFHAVDDSTSVKADSLIITPNENLVSTFDFGFSFSQYVSLRGEIGVSAFSLNTKATKLDEIQIPDLLFTPNNSTQIDGAAKLNLSITPSKYWSVIISSRYIGPGFYTLGYALMPNDLMELTFAPRLRLLKNKVNIRSKIGVRYNNLRDSKMATTNRLTGMLNANWQVSKNFGIDANYNKNQIESLHKNDTLRLSNVYNSYSITPRFNFDAFGGSNNLIMTYSFQDVSDKNIYTMQVSDNNTNSVTLIHILSYINSLSFTSTVLNNRTIMESFDSRIFHFNETVGYRFLKKKLNTSFSLGANFVGNIEKSSHLVFRVNTSYSFGKFGNLGFFMTNNSFKETGTIARNYNELYGSLQYNISF